MGYIQRLGDNDFRLRVQFPRRGGRRITVSQRFYGSLSDATTALKEFEQACNLHLPPVPSPRQESTHVYAIVPDIPHPEIVKIGRARNVQHRLKSLATGSPLPSDYWPRGTVPIFSPANGSCTGNTANSAPTVNGFFCSLNYVMKFIDWAR